MVAYVLTITKCSITLVAMNATLNSFIENKRLQLSQQKCSFIHVGKSLGSCYALKIHAEKMYKEDSTKYLKAVASLSVIRAFFEDILLGIYRN